MFLSFQPASPSPRRRCRGAAYDPWGIMGRHFPTSCSMEVDRQAAENEELEALDALLSTPLRFISALAAAQNRTQTDAQKRKEAAAAPKKQELFEVKMNVEGYKPSELDVKLVQNSLTISGKHEHDDETGSVSRSFTRTWNIPEDVQLEGLTCNFNSKDNTMMISAPKKVVELPPPVEKAIPISVTTPTDGETGDKTEEKIEDPVTTTPTPDVSADMEEAMNAETSSNEPTVEG
ncbi:heat shock protein 23 [Folsomia candida]|nr:heat shock protein 23 [Folsomia candida]